ncbi:MAG: hypothetical protein M1837_004201 [Sclerophora amabilis]|nr:MAG: hypothetical protein M1837_004201 [Sclerophora amabilis]
MKFLKHIRSKSKLKESDSQSTDYPPPAYSGPSKYSHSLAAHPQLPNNILETIFAFVCPHTEDESREPPEKSMVADGCMLCDLRDLAQCAPVCRKWYESTQKAMYHSVRVDAVHFCEREAILAEKRKRRSFFDRNADPKDAPTQRLQLLSRTLRNYPRLAVQVEYLKMPYMTRETCKADLARTVSVLPNLLYVDLPEGCFSNDGSCMTLMQELQARCPEIKKMKYIPGSEASFTMLAQRLHWQGLEDVEISRVKLEPTTFVEVLASLPTLHNLQLSDLPWFDDSVFQLSHPSFPPLHTLTLTDLPSLTASGLKTYLATPVNAEVLSSLTFSGTGITTTTLHLILPYAPHLTYLSITETVSRAFPHLEQIPPLRSSSLETLYFEVTSSSSTPSHSLHSPAESYYAYLGTSLHANTLPNLRGLYVRDVSFPEMLVSAPASNTLKSPSSPFFHPTNFLTIYTKGPEEVSWNFTSLSPPPPRAPFRGSSHSHSRSMNAMASPTYSTFSRSSLTPSYASGGGGLTSPRFFPNGNRMSTQSGPRNSSDNDSLLRPSSSASSTLAPPPPLNWGGRDARRSLVIGNGAGGFLAVPNEEEIDKHGSLR